MLIKAKDISIDNKLLIKFIKTLDPPSYVDYSFKSKLKPSVKAKLTKIWLKVTNYSFKELNYFRNKHPHWRKQIDKNATERNSRRNNKYNFYDKKKYPASRKWTKEELKEFFKLTNIKKDRELAEYFKRSIPSIQYLRRKIRSRKLPKV